MADTRKTGTGVAPRERAVGPFGDFDRLFDALTQGFFVAPFSRGAFGGNGSSAEYLTMPKADVSETDKAYRMTLELPGVDEKDVDIAVSDGILTIRGRKESERKEEKESYHLTERAFGSFERSMRLPSTVAQDKVSASFDKGVLTVEMPKSAETQTRTRRIPIGR